MSGCKQSVGGGTGYVLLISSPYDGGVVSLSNQEGGGGVCFVHTQQSAMCTLLPYGPLQSSAIYLELMSRYCCQDNTYQLQNNFALRQQCAPTLRACAFLTLRETIWFAHARSLAGALSAQRRRTRSYQPAQTP